MQMKNDDLFFSQNPRYAELSKRHGDPMDLLIEAQNRVAQKKVSVDAASKFL
jgi:hypothetical protein